MEDLYQQGYVKSLGVAKWVVAMGCDGMWCDVMTWERCGMLKCGCWCTKYVRMLYAGHEIFLYHGGVCYACMSVKMHACEIIFPVPLVIYMHLFQFWTWSSGWNIILLWYSTRNQSNWISSIYITCTKNEYCIWTKTWSCSDRICIIRYENVHVQNSCLSWDIDHVCVCMHLYSCLPCLRLYHLPCACHVTCVVATGWASLFRDPIIARIVAIHNHNLTTAGKTASITPAQVILRWSIQHGVPPTVTATKHNNKHYDHTYHIGYARIDSCMYNREGVVIIVVDPFCILCTACLILICLVLFYFSIAHEWCITCLYLWIIPTRDEINWYHQSWTWDEYIWKTVFWWSTISCIDDRDIHTCLWQWSSTGRATFETIHNITEHHRI